MNSIDEAALRAQIAELTAEVEMRRASAYGKLSFKIGEKGGISVCGMGKFPTTLYVEQWERIIAQVDDLKAFIEAHRPELKTKLSIVRAA